MAYRSLDPFRNFEFWESASVSEVRSEVENGALVSSFSSSTWLPSHLAHLRSLWMPEEPNERFGALRKNGGLTVLHWAVAGGASAEVVSYLLSLGIPVDDDDLRDAIGATALHYAAQRGASEICALLLEHGADIEAWSEWGTPLQWAVSGLDPQMLVVISDRYGSLSQLQPDGGMLFLMPTGWMDDPIFQSDLFQSGNGAVVDSLYRIVGVWPRPRADVPTLKLMLGHCADIGVRAPRFGWTVLHLAAMFNPDPEITRLLIEYGSDMTAVTESDGPYDGFDLGAVTPLIAAASEGNLDVFRMLLDFGAPGLIGLDRSLLPHQVSLLGASQQILTFLTDTGYDVHLQDEAGNSALDYAVAGGNGEAVQFLTDQGVRLNASLSPLDEENGALFSAGDLLFHQYFGMGTVTGVEEVSRDKVITVNFGDTVGPRHLSVAFAPVRRLWLK